MPSNLKKRIRARMEKTGESHQAAQRRVRAAKRASTGPGQGTAIDPWKIDFVKHLQEMNVLTAESMIKLAEHEQRDPTVAALVERARHELMVVKTHHERVLQRLVQGDERGDSALEDAAQHLHGTLGDAQEAALSALQRRYSLQA